jgi:hypothetical protein
MSQSQCASLTTLHQAQKCDTSGSIGQTVAGQSASLQLKRVPIEWMDASPPQSDRPLGFVWPKLGYGNTRVRLANLMSCDLHRSKDDACASCKPPTNFLGSSGQNSWRAAAHTRGSVPATLRPPCPQQIRNGWRCEHVISERRFTSAVQSVIGKGDPRCKDQAGVIRRMLASTNGSA